MTGEMSREEVTRENFPIHFAIADAFDGEVFPFDQYQGPFVHNCTGKEKGKFWIICFMEECDLGHDHDTGLVQVYNEKTDKLSEPFSPNNLNDAIQAAKETL